jgi:hypothetical protein
MAGCSRFWFSRHQAATETQVPPSTTSARGGFSGSGVIFAFRAAPPVGPGLQWWQIDVLGYDQGFFGLLALPTIGMLFGLHHWTEAQFGFGARTIGLVDTALAAPLTQLGMIPMLALIAVHAPEGRQATWFALVASLMNLALQAGAILLRGLNTVFLVERGEFGALPALVIVATLAGLLLALGAVAGLGPWLQPAAEEPGTATPKRMPQPQAGGTP